MLQGGCDEETVQNSNDSGIPYWDSCHSQVVSLSRVNGANL